MNRPETNDELLQLATNALRDRGDVDRPAELDVQVKQARESRLAKPSRSPRWSWMHFTGVFGAVAMTLLVAILVLLSPGVPVTLAEVSEEVERREYLRYVVVSKSSKFFGPVKPGPPTVTHRRTVYVDLKRNRRRLESEYVVGGEKYSSVVIRDNRAGKVLSIDSRTRKATLTEFKRTPGNSMAFLERLREMQNDDSTQKSKGKLNGRGVLIYRRVIDLPRNRSVSWTVWIDPKAKLPVQTKDEVPHLDQTSISRDYDWAAKIKNPDKFFSFDAPDGYELVRQ